ncbi:MAG TPA: hypothetical protein VLS48_04885, partial [Anaerolineales bacterium]|nr:hypothetical protein [Anaerolineales bacterium]
MVKQIKALFTPPVYPEDEDKTRIVRLLHIILLALTILLLFNTIVAILLLQNTLATLLNSATVFITIALFTVLRRGYVQAAAILTVSIFWVVV